MPDDVRGPLSPDGEGPDSQDRGASDEAFAAVVLDETFVKAAEIHEPSAAERILYAALERAESEAAAEPGFADYPEADAGTGPSGFDDEDEYADGEAAGEDDEGRFDRSDYTRYLPEEDDESGDGRFGAYEEPYSPHLAAPAAYGAGLAGRAPGRGWRPARWQRPVACVLAVVMGLSVLAFALIAVQRAGSQRQEPRPAPSIAPGEPPVVGETDRDTDEPGAGT